MKVVHFAACAALAVSSTTIADTTLDFDGQGGEPPQQILVRSGQVMMRSADGEDMLYDQRRRQLTVIDHEQRGYFVMSPEAMAEGTQAMQARSQEQMQQLQSELGPVMEQMRQQMQAMLDDPNMPPSQKRMIEQQMREMSAAAGASSNGPGAEMYAPQPLMVEATGENRRVAGTSCAVHVVTEAGHAIEEVCVASPRALGMPQDDYQTMRSMFAYMREIAEQATGIGDGLAMPDFEGVPVQSKDLEDGSVSTLRAISTNSIDPGAFAVPGGYGQLNPFQ